MKVEIINIGDELLIGQILNTNAYWLGQRFTEAGFIVNRMLQVPDRHAEIIAAFRKSLQNADIVIVTGGLGPTRDDITRKALCDFFHCKMKKDEKSESHIRDLFRKRKLPITQTNLDQALVPENCRAIPNASGTSPGMWFQSGNKVLVALPGVPFELRQMTDDFVLPKILRIFKPSPIYIRNILTTGMGESFLSDLLHKWEKALPPHISLAYLPEPGLIRLRLLARGKDYNKIKSETEVCIAELNGLIPELIFGYDNDSLEKIIGQMLLKKNASLSTAESCTGGAVAQMITSVPGSSAYFRGSVIAYANDIKKDVLGVPAAILNKSGAVSSQTVRKMAESIRIKFTTDYAIAVSGVAGPDGGSAQKPVGTVWIAVAGPGKITARLFRFGDDRARNVRRASLAALNMLRLFLVKH